MNVLNQFRQDLACALSLFTRLPVFWLLTRAQRADKRPWPLARSLWLWPFVGAFTGFAGGIVGWFLEAIMHIAPWPAVTLTLAAQVALTGGFHDDGLADMADSYGAHTREHKLDIMRDSHIGSYGVLALCLSVLTKVGALSVLPATALIPALMCSGLLARATMIWVPVVLSPARNNGLARLLSPVPLIPFLFAQACSVMSIACWVYWWNAAYSPVFSTLILPLLMPFFSLGIMVMTAYKNFGGYTGDVLGATATITECLVLAALSASK
ncbi:hypothetical protein HK11_11875 [Acetobacter sp. DmW_043]|uniref:adenosylcobinamide-GDP ribazoletransferase n=1 Tax=Acetobacter sp. DmW_043 TaxID=1670658 RepID=UPI000A365731|nr:adenosylcobinamide-GDP ribazoletransferase [Acetobacter sp. DmW_043]OUI87396.1 hypothetical protein HK11_11875 [Acetobacter sp. DmW_043]